MESLAAAAPLKDCRVKALDGLVRRGKPQVEAQEKHERQPVQFLEHGLPQPRPIDALQPVFEMAVLGAQTHRAGSQLKCEAKQKC